MTQLMKRRRRRHPTVQTVSRKTKKLDPDDFLLEGKSVTKPGLQTATHWLFHNHFLSLNNLLPIFFILKITRLLQPNVLCFEKVFIPQPQTGVHVIEILKESSS